MARPNNYGKTTPQVYTFFEGQWQVEAYTTALAETACRLFKMDINKSGFSLEEDGLLYRKEEEVPDKLKAVNRFLFIVFTQALGSRHIFLCRNVIELAAANDLIEKLVQI